MKLQSVALARSAWIFQTASLNPRGKSLVPILYSLVQRYSFVKFPKTAEQMTGKEVKFENGRFMGTTGENIDVGLTMYNDGFVADSRSTTDDSDLFLLDVLTWLHDECGLASYEEVTLKKIYTSELYITCEQSLNSVNRELVEFRGKMSHHDYGYEKHPIDIIGLYFGSDPQNTMLRSFAFTFERAVNVPFAQNSYFSSAPFRTETHLAFLNKLENILSQFREAL